MANNTTKAAAAIAAAANSSPENKPAAFAAAAKAVTKVTDAPAAKAARADKLAKALSGLAYPAADNGAAWLGLLAELPALAEIVAASRAGKYGQGKGLVPGASDLLRVTAIGKPMAASGAGKNGKPNAQAATCRAVANACAALQSDKVCKAAAVFFMLTDGGVLQLLRASKAVQYVGRTGTPCPAWAAGYVNGNVRADMLAKG